MFALLGVSQPKRPSVRAESEFEDNEDDADDEGAIDHGGDNSENSYV